ncbi:MAG: M20/M25/M40 family metallo-hydrolase [Trueperaceae bacterium]|nr:M20/M25/M40 family metallo-hydrolase [Trueperaceae bacterium]
MNDRADAAAGAAGGGVRDRLRARLLELCATPSPSLSEAAVVALVRRDLERLGLTVREDDAGERLGGDSGNLIAELAGGRPERVVLNAHLDTVPLVPGAPLAPFVEGDMIRTDGTQILGADDKAGVAVVLGILHALASTPLERRPTVVAVFTVAEERGLLGAHALDVAALRADVGFAFDGEVPVGEVITGAVYKESLRIVVRGRRAHAALEPEKGVHAIAAAAAVVAGFPLGRDGDRVANLGRISGGGASNVVPDEVVLEGEARAFDADDLEGLLAAIRATAARAVDAFGASVRVDRERLYDGYDVPADAAALLWLRAAAPRHGLRLTTVRSIGGSDTNVFNGKGLQTVNVGLGMHGIHSVDEWIDVGDLARVVGWVVGALVEQPGGGAGAVVAP